MTAAMFDRRAQVYTVTLIPYNQTALDAIKAVVPPYARRWCPSRREWSIDEAYGQRLAAALRRLDCTIVGLDSPQNPAQNPAHAADSAGWARAVFQRVGPNRAPQAYKLLSRLCHPDHGGDHQLQTELNQAFGELSTRKRTA
jgi:hypothetical protein